MLKPLPYRQVVSALIKLNCEVVRDEESEDHIAVCRGAMKIFNLPKDTVSVFVLQRMLSCFSFSQQEFLNALYCIN